MENFDLVYLACDCIEENEGKDIVVVDTRKIPNLVEYFVFVSAKDHTQVATIADKVTELLSKKKVDLLQREGFGMADWIALDFGAFFIHIFTKDEREKYNIEKLVSDGKNAKKYESIKKEAQKTVKKQAKDEVKKENKLSIKKVEKVVKNKEKPVKAKDKNVEKAKKETKVKKTTKEKIDKKKK